MKKILPILIAILFVASLTGCGLKEKINEKIGEKIIEKATDSKVNVDGDKVTVKGEDGSQLTIGGTEWPDGEILKDVPKFEKGKITGSQVSDETALIYVEEVELTDYEEYIEKIKNDFSLDQTTFNFEDAKSYGGKNESGIIVQITYNTNDKSITMSVVIEKE